MRQDEGSVTLSTDQDGRITAKAVIISGGIGSFTPRALPTGDEWLGKGVRTIRAFVTGTRGQRRRHRGWRRFRL